MPGRERSGSLPAWRGHCPQHFQCRVAVHECAVPAAQRQPPMGAQSLSANRPNWPGFRARSATIASNSAVLAFRELERGGATVEGDDPERGRGADGRDASIRGDVERPTVAAIDAVRLLGGAGRAGAAQSRGRTVLVTNH